MKDIETRSHYLVGHKDKMTDDKYLGHMPHLCLKISDNINNSQCYFPLSWKQPQKLPYHGTLGRIE